MKLLPLLLTILLTASFNSTAHSNHDQHQVQQSREAHAWQMINKGALIIDARTAQEYAQGHIKGAINIPFDVSVEQFNALEIRKDREVVLYCRSGNRSGKALKMLRAAGYSKLHNGGGFEGLMANKK